MKLKSKLLSFIALSVLSQSVSAIPFSFEARSLGMGGVSVATADLATAAWANPAMLTNQRPDDDFSLLVGAGAFLRDDDDLITDIKDFQSADDRRTNAIDAGDISGTTKALLDMGAILRRLEGKVIAPEVTGVAAMGMAFDSFAMAVSIRGDVIAGGTVTDISTNPAEIVSDQFNILNIEGVLATEIGVSLAKDFWVSNKKLSVGIKPKIVDLQAFTLREAIINASAGFNNINKEDNKVDLGTFTTFDLGFAVDLSKSFRLGLNIRNLISDSFNVKGQTLNFDTEARIGAAYRNRLLTVAVDYDLIENEPLLANQSFNGLKTRFIAVGAEFNAFDFAQLRVGASKNLASGIPGNAKDTTLTGGIGFWLGFNLDMAVTFRDNSLGGFVQTGFRF
ncbi:MAG: conjugal transfer protein TraF [Gammaproteobacteria bacterium]